MEQVQSFTKRYAWSMALSALMLAWLVVFAGPAKPADTQRTQPGVAEVVANQPDADRQPGGQPWTGSSPQKLHSVNWN
jgi:hypothetical protein